MNIKRNETLFPVKGRQNHLKLWGGLCGQFSCLNMTVRLAQSELRSGTESDEDIGTKNSLDLAMNRQQTGDVPHRRQKKSNTSVALQWLKTFAEKRDSWIFWSRRPHGKKLAARQDLTSSFVCPDEGNGSDCWSWWAQQLGPASSFFLTWVSGLEGRGTVGSGKHSFSGPWLSAGWFYGWRCRGLQSSAVRQ